jgi:hypothetical protein
MSTKQPNYHEPVLKFDQYSVKWEENGWVMYQLFKGVSWLAAEITAGTNHFDFCQSVEHTGWCGTCPEWTGWKPIVTIPMGEKIDIEHLDFILESM